MLALWKRQYISKEGRLIPIKSTLSSMHIYYVFIMHAQIGQAEAITSSKRLSKGWGAFG